MSVPANSDEELLCWQFHSAVWDHHTHTLSLPLSLSTPTTESPSLAKLPSEDDIVAMQWGVSGTLIISKLPIKSPTNRILETDMQQGSGELRS